MCVLVWRWSVDKVWQRWSDQSNIDSLYKSVSDKNWTRAYKRALARATTEKEKKTTKWKRFWAFQCITFWYAVNVILIHFYFCSFFSCFSWWWWFCGCWTVVWLGRCGQCVRCWCVSNFAAVCVFLSLVGHFDDLLNVLAPSINKNNHPSS